MQEGQVLRCRATGLRGMSRTHPSKGVGPRVAASVGPCNSCLVVPSTESIMMVFTHCPWL
jgi:hypothetical protein